VDSDDAEEADVDMDDAEHTDTDNIVTSSAASHVTARNTSRARNEQSASADEDVPALTGKLESPTKARKKRSQPVPDAPGKRKTTRGTQQFADDPEMKAQATLAASLFQAMVAAEAAYQHDGQLVNAWKGGVRQYFNDPKRKVGYVPADVVKYVSSFFSFGPSC
jgi:hypothetical protein